MLDKLFRETRVYIELEEKHKETLSELEFRRKQTENLKEAIVTLAEMLPEKDKDVRTIISKILG